ncbi:unconventional myosin-IXb isoform X14 [Dermochelys coriacea]|uniref:unconventional myosin-IXb isoform X14 n=1 Tax=Dermochelys coriacea TaxID=27794 RepID=UPI001CA88C67|nr:unconventional myosin-IXb isoform X14 [Dermochelys coriacea]
MNLKDAGSAVCQEKAAYNLHIYPQLSTESTTCCSVTATKDSTTSDVIKDVIHILNLDVSKHYVLVEVKESGGEEWVLDLNDSPVHRVLLWPRRAQDEHPQNDGYYFLLQERDADGTIKYVHMQFVSKEKDARRLVERGFLPWHQEDFDDLCNLSNLTETTLLENLKRRFLKHKIYTYAGSILIAINPFKFLPIYNPKYVKMYENHQLGKLEPHIFAIADVAYHTMLKKHVNQCIVISGESGSGKTQSTNFLIHCLTALSQKGYASGVERTILGAGPVLEAFGNAKTAHNNNSSRFGKFIQVNYLENGIVRGAVVEKYLLEKSRLVSQEKDERNYHVFYYLLLGVSEEERKEFHLQQPEDYFYLNQHNLKIEDGEDLRHDFERLKQAMEMVGFLPATKKQIFSVLSAILYLGNVTYKKRATGRDEGLEVGPPEVLDTLSQLLKVKREILVEVLTKRKTVTANDKLILPYSLSEAITARDSMAKSLYSALFDWIVLRINHALLNKKDMEESVTCLSIGVLDIFGFEDFETNSFEQFCINYANEQLQYYFNQHIFKLEQEEYQSEGIAWHNIDYTDNVTCIHLISKKPTGLFYLLDEESNFPHATNQTLLAKFKQQYEENKFFVGTPVKEPAFIIRHFAGKVKYQIKDFREKNMDYMRPDIVALLRSSDSAYVRELIGMDPVAVFRWAILRAAIRAMAVFAEAGRQRAQKTAGVVRHGPRVPLGELQRANTPVEKVYRDLHDQIIKSIKGLPWQGEDPCRLLRSLSRLQQPRFHFLKSRGTKQKQIIPKNLLDSKSLKLIVSMTLHDRTTKSLLHLHKKKKPPSISAQFQNSLNKLLETLGKAEPFFIRCIRSNAEKRELFFDEGLVLQQLRYTGMLETVRIRRSGYSAKYTFQDFKDQFQVLLPQNAKASKEEISAHLNKLKLDKNNYQIGKTKVFMKEAERQMLQDTLHKEVIRKIVLLQSWLRMVLERRNFLRMRQATITLQTRWRSYRIRRALERTNAAIYIQSVWRGYRERESYHQQRKRISLLQALVRGHLQRKRKKGTTSSLDDIANFARSVTMIQPSLVSLLLHHYFPKQTVQRKSNEQLSPLDSAVSVQSPNQPMDAKSTFKSPLRKLLGKKPDKKYIKESPDVMEEGETLPRLLCIPTLEAVESQKLSEAPSGHPRRPQVGVRPVKETSKGKRNRNIKISKISAVSEKWPASVFREITNANELKYLDEFLLNKINDLNSQKSATECLFFEATEKFRGNIKTMYSVPNGQIHVGYKDLMENYQLLVINLAKEREEKDVKLVLNLFQSLLDEFSRGYAKKEESEQHKQSKTQKKKRKQERAIEEHNGHVFKSYQVSIRQSCEQCSSYIWPMEKACLCSICKLICHKKCMSKTQSCCTSPCGKKNDQGVDSRHFGVCVSSLISDKNSVPVVMEKLLEYVEMHGLYTEGIYRKSGSANRMRELKQLLQTDPNSVKLENYPIHTITGILKQWLRELPDPLMTFAQYSDFLRAVELPEKQEQLVAIYSVLEQLPQANHNTLERLIFHLVKVALIEDVNRMSPNALAIVFAPCLLRCPDNSDPLTSMKDVSKTTMCVEMLIKEQMRKYKIKMGEINQLEAAESIAFRRLSLLRQNTLWPVKLGFSSPYEGVLSKSPQVRGNDNSFPELGSLQEEDEVSDVDNREKEILIERIQSIKEEKEDITYRLPELDQQGSDEENLDSETSVSTESLPEDRIGRLDTEGTALSEIQCHGRCPSVPAKDSCGGPNVSLPLASTVSSVTKCRPSSMLVKMKVPCRNPVMPTANIKLPYGITKLTESQSRTPAIESQPVVRRRDRLARRTDKIHSVYIAQGSVLAQTQEPLDEYEPTAKVKRRFSDPYSRISCIDE